MLDIKELEKRMDNWDEAKKIFAAFAECDLLHAFTATGINAADMLGKLTKGQINKICGAICNTEKEFTTFEALGCFNSFLLFYFAKTAAFPGLSELATVIIASQKLNPSQQENKEQQQDGLN